VFAHRDCPAGRAPSAGGAVPRTVLDFVEVLPLVGTEFYADHREGRATRSHVRSTASPGVRAFFVYSFFKDAISMEKRYLTSCLRRRS